ncbi:MAG: ketoacyl-ACP synthase III [Chlamydiales bacterium]|nr:ketoacyl-ACP synthase III [Chlamydiia bacterium]MCP5507322.1 ketoacyl-ACP synthase III [Chlamydiales bacterium]
MVSHSKARIIGVGSYLPERVLSNADLETMVDTTDEWITKRTGMKERRIARDDEATSDMGAAAAEKALKAAGITADELDLILVGTMSPDYLSPSTSCIIQNKIGAKTIPAIDFQSACTGFIYGLSIAKAYIESGTFRNILLVASEKMSAFTDYTDRGTCILFGDGASAAVISGEGAGLAVDTICLGSDGSLADLIMIPAGGSRLPPSKETVDQGSHYIKLQGKEVFKHAVRRMESAMKECMQKAGKDEQQISWLVPHQANLRIIDATAKYINLAEERVYKTVHKYGNTSASSVAIALNELLDEHVIHEGEHLILVAFGAGLTWGSALLTKVES